MRKRELERLVGRRVKSRYRARWVGTVVSLSEKVEGCVLVRVDTDQCGHLLRKPIMKHLHVNWLEELL